MTKRSKSYITPVNFRIVGGSNAELERYRWAVSLQRDDTHFCGGSLIGSKHIISAKHCTNLKKYPVAWIGGLDLRNKQEFQIIKTIRLYEHPEADAVIYELERPVDNIYPIPLNSNPNLPVGSEQTTIGWGRITENGPTSMILQQVTLKLIDQDVCERIIGSMYNPKFNICAGVLSGGQDACSGDSGGALLYSVNIQDPRSHVLTGIISFGFGCARKGLAGGWVSVAAILKWIQNIVPDCVVVDAELYQNLYLNSLPINMAEGIRKRIRRNMATKDKYNYQYSSNNYSSIIFLIIIVVVIWLLWKKK